VSRWNYLLTEAGVIVRYFTLIVFPVGQNLDHDLPFAQALDGRTIPAALAVLGLLAAAGAALVRMRKKPRSTVILIPFGILWFFLTLSVESSLIPLADPIFEHRLYLPVFGLFLAASVLLTKAAERFAVGLHTAAILILLLVLALGAVSHLRNRVWKDPVTLWSDVTVKSPRKARGWNNLGQALITSGREEEALAMLGRAIELDPKNTDPLVNRGSIHSKRGRYREAIEDFRRAVAIEPGWATTRNNLGNALVKSHSLGKLRLLIVQLPLEKIVKSLVRLGSQRALKSQMSQTKLSELGINPAQVSIDPRALGVDSLCPFVIVASLRPSPVVIMGHSQ
jgi:tetratricopeptide (TPR) repeat protein